MYLFVVALRFLKKNLFYIICYNDVFWWYAMHNTTIYSVLCNNYHNLDHPYIYLLPPFKSLILDLFL